MEDVSAADELVAGDGGVGEEDGDDAEDAGGLVVAGFEQVGDGELGELAGARGDEVDEQKAGPSAGGLARGRRSRGGRRFPRRRGASRSRSSGRAG